MKPLLIIIIICVLLFLAGVYTLHDPDSTSQPVPIIAAPAGNATMAQGETRPHS